MKNIIQSIIGFLILTTSIQAQTPADAVINKYITAVGGAENCRKIQSILVEGYYQQKKVKMPFTLQSIHLKGLRLEITAGSKKLISIVTPQQSWTKNPLAGDTMHKDPEKEFRLKLDDLDIQGDVVDYKTKGTTVHYQGKWEENKNTYDKILLITANHTKKTYYFDQKTGLIYKMEALSYNNGMLANGVTLYRNYKLIDGVLLPYELDYTCDQGCAMTVIITKQEINAPIDESAFSPNR
jgi:hypothetical protein